MKDFIDWFFLNKDRTPEGLFSHYHLFAVTYTLFNLVVLMVYLGLKYKNNKKAIEVILKISAFTMIALYVFEILELFISQFTVYGLTLSNPEGVSKFFGLIASNIPLYLCDIAIFAIPILAFTKGRIRTIISDFLAIWGIPMGVIGTYLAGNLFPIVPVFSFDAWVAIYLHVVPAAVTVFLYITRIASLKKENMWINFGMFIGFMSFVLLYVNLVNPIYDHVNFMFFMRGDGTPFDLFRPYVPLPVYQIIVFVLYATYMLLFYGVYYLILNKYNKHKESKTVSLSTQS